MPTLPSSLKMRLRAGALGAAMALGAACFRPAPPPKSTEGLSRMLGAAAGGSVNPAEVVWEPGGGVVEGAFLGRHVLFLAAPSGHTNRDLFRARVRLSAEGQPIDVRGLRNLTETPLGDDAGLELRGHTAVFATTAFGRVQGITALDTDGIAAGDRPRTLAGRALLALASYRHSGSFSGVGRTDIVLDAAARSARIVLAPPRLEVDFAEPSQVVALDLGTVELSSPTGAGEVRGLRAVRQGYAGRSVLTWAVDLTRSVVGTTPVAVVEEWAFGVRDLVRRSASKLFGWSPESRPRKGAPPPAARVLTPTELAASDPGWPPQPIPVLWETPKPGEGQWTAVTYPFLPSLPAAPKDAPPPYFYTTFIRPDPERPYAEVLLVAMDMRQLELGMEGGYEEPQPVVGPPGTGRIPRGAIPRVVGAFNGAFKAEHGAYGMMVNRRLLLPPVTGAATVLVTTDGAARFGSWPASASLPDDVVSFRQNLDPLVDGGVQNPSHRTLWGWQLPGDGSLTERTAVCLTPGGHVYYAWARDMTGAQLGRALKQAGCDYAMHLDMNPRHCGFVFMHAASPASSPGAANRDPMRDGIFRLADPGMTINPARYVMGSDKDFFYVMLRDVKPTDATGLAWAPSPGVQPPPAWLPGLYESTARVGDLTVHLTAFDAGRVDWVVRAGSEEPSITGAPSKKVGLEPELEGKAVAVVGLGHTTDALRYGLAFGPRASLDLRQSHATLVLRKGTAPRLLPPGERAALAPGEEAVQLPLLANDGIVDSRATDRGGTRQRGALCITPTGRVLVATARHDSNDPLASVLVDAGCRRVVALDRGSRHASFVHRAGTDDAPLSRYDTSVLYAIGRPMVPHAYRWSPETAVATAP